MPKIALIGAGSVVFARSLISDILTYPELRDSAICLMDIDPERLGLITGLAERMVAQEGAETEIQSTLDRREALRDADYVVTMIQVGGLQMFEVDIKIPLRYGIDQTVGDTLGPGASSAAFAPSPCSWTSAATCASCAPRRCSSTTPTPWPSTAGP